MLGKILGRLRSERWALCNEADGSGDEEDAEPALPGDMLVEPEVGDEHNEDVAECSGGKDKGEVGPGERCEVAGEKADEEGDAERNPRSEDGGDERAGV